MFTNDLCSSSQQSFNGLSAKKICNHGGEFLNQPSATLSNFDDTRTSKCSKCDKVSFSMTQADTELLDNQNESSGGDKIYYFDDQSSSTSNIYQPGPSGMGYFQEHLDYGSDSNVVEPIKFDDNGDSIPDEFMNFVSDDPNNNFDADLNFLPWIETEFYFDVIAEPIASVSDEGEKSVEGGELSQTNSSNSAGETQCVFELNLTTASQGCHMNTAPKESIYPCSEGNENTMKGQELSSVEDEKQSKAEKTSRIGKIMHPVFSTITKQRVSVEEINEKIKSNLTQGTIGGQNKKIYICGMKHGCRKAFSLPGIRDHLFSNLFFIQCEICKVKYHYISQFNQHLKTCKEPSMIETSDPEEQIIDTETGRKRTFEEKFDEWKHPTFKKGFNERVTVNEVMAKISENYAFVKDKDRPYVCLVRHDCPRSYLLSNRVKDHLFSTFFFYKCAACGRKSRRTDNVRRHLIYCKGKTRSGLTFLEEDNSASEESDEEQIDSVETTEESSTVLEHDLAIESDQGQKKKTRKRKGRGHGFRVYRCPFCDYKCAPGGRGNVMEHLNGRLKSGKILAPYCYARKRMKPADPKTGLYERLQPILVKPEDI